MGYTVFFLSLLFLSQTAECSDLEEGTSTTLQPSTAINFDSDLANRITTDSTETIKEPSTGPKEGSTSSGSTSSKSNSPGSTEKVTSEASASSQDGVSASGTSTPASSVDGSSTQATDRSTKGLAGQNKRPLIVDLGSLQNIRIRRDNEEEFVDSSDFAQEDAFNQQEAENSENPRSQSGCMFSSSSKETGNMNEQSGESVIEGSPDIAEEMGESEARGERKTDSEEILEGTEQRRGKAFADYDLPLQRKYWASHEEHRYHNLIKIPVFPGK